MPVLESRFRPPALLASAHVQTILPAILPRTISLQVDLQRLELADGDFLDLAWTRTGSKRLAILSHGLEGCFSQTYIRGMAAALLAAGWDCLAWNFRGCGSEPNRLLRFYHSGETGDLRRIIEHAAPGYPRIALVGFSLGGNLTLKYLGESKPHPAVVGAAAISAPIDLASSARALDLRLTNRLYLTRFLKTLIAKIETKAPGFPGSLDITGIRAIRSFAAFDNRYTAPLHQFRDAEDYWDQASSRQYLGGITVPTLLLNARNDPFLAAPSFPFEEASQHPFLHFEAPGSGGHVGFLDFKAGLQPWTERRIPAFLGRIFNHDVVEHP